jgi:hypothetical protein
LNIFSRKEYAWRTYYDFCHQNNVGYLKRRAFAQKFAQYFQEKYNHARAKPDQSKNVLTTEDPFQKNVLRNLLRRDPELTESLKQLICILGSQPK